VANIKIYDRTLTDKGEIRGFYFLGFNVSYKMRK